MNFPVLDFGPRILQLNGISGKAVEEHLKLYKGYVNKSNEILQKLETVDRSTANQVYSEVRSLKVELSFALAGKQNHEIYFSHLKPDGGEPKGALMKQIEQDFGGFDKYVADLKASGISARGWSWTVWFPEMRKLLNWVGDSQNTYLTWNLKPVLALDVYEHAYFMDYGVDRGKYIDAFVRNIDWDTVAANFEAARK
jgi:superoxide dismutase, Fe-Mn family